MRHSIPVIAQERWRAIPTPSAGRRIAMLVSVLSLCLLACNRKPEEPPAHPHIIFYITDDIGWNDLGCTGNRNVETPHIDRLAGEGILFENAYLATSSCSPSRASILTGRYPHNHGAPELHTKIDSLQPSLARKLQEAGYYTVISGKIHGFDATEESWDVVSRGEGPGRQEEWVELLRARDTTRPFFCWFASVDAHRGWQETGGIPVYDPDELEVPPMLFDGPVTREDLALYYHEVSRTDHFMGEIVSELKAQGIYDNTVIIHCSDNGRPFPRCKTRCYDSGMKTYLIVRGPGIRPGRSDAPVSSIDIAPTVLELAGVEAGPMIQGVSFVPLLEDLDGRTRDFTFSERNWHVYQAHERMVRFGQWMYIRNAFPERRANCQESNLHIPAGVELWDAHTDGRTTPEQEDVFLQPRPAEELYDVRADPYQFVNLAGDPRYSDELDFLRGVLDQWTAETGDNVPDNPTNDRQDVTGLKPGSEPFERGEIPGETLGADTITAPGPVLMEDIKKQPDSQQDF